MKYSELIDPLFNTGLFGNNKAEFGRKLFLAAGPKTDISTSTIKTWLKEVKKYRTGSYFPDDSINESQFIHYLKKYANDNDVWKKLQEAFLLQKTSDLTSQDFCVDLKTEDPEVFYWSLLNQFQEIFHLPKAEQKKDSSALEISRKELSSEQVKDAFLEAVQEWKVMEIINRKPAILNRTDSAYLNTFLSQMDVLTRGRNSYDASLHMSIHAFIEALELQVLTLDANLNLRFAFEDNTASFNMEDDETCEEYREKAHEMGILEFSPELLDVAADPIGLLETYVIEWGNFREKMNCLFKNISSWQNKAQA